MRRAVATRTAPRIARILYLVPLVSLRCSIRIEVGFLPHTNQRLCGSEGGRLEKFLGETHGSAVRFVTRAMKWIYIAVSIYLLLGVLGYWGNSGTAGIELVAGKKPSLLRRICIVLFWPLAMIGAIEA